MGQRRGAVVWGCAGAQCGAVQGRSVGLRGGSSSVGLRRDAARSSPGGQRGAVEGRSVELRTGVAAWGCAGAQRAAAQWWEAAQGRIMGPRRGAVRSCAGVQQRGAAQSSCAGRRSGGGAV